VIGDKLNGPFPNVTFEECSPISDFTRSSITCVLLSDISSSRLRANGNDGWYLVDFTTEARTMNGAVVELTRDMNLFRWLDGDQVENYPYDATQLTLTAIPLGMFSGMH